MAISKEKTLSNGAVGNYWKIYEVKILKINMRITYYMVLYMDKAHADLDQRLGPDKSFEAEVSKSELIGDIIALGYAKIKAANDPDLVDGQDV